MKLFILIIKNFERVELTNVCTDRVLKSNQMTLTEVPVTGSQSPIAVWGPSGAEATVTCSVPFNLTLPNLTELRCVRDYCRSLLINWCTNFMFGILF